MPINISNILTQLNTKMTSDSSANTTELLRRVQLYNSLNNIGVLEYQSYGDLPPVDSSNIGQLAYVRASLDDSFGTFFFSKAFVNDSGYYDALDSTNSGWQKIVLNANDSDNFADITAAGGGSSYTFQGSVNGYSSGGQSGPSNTRTSTIDKFPFSADANATDVGDLTIALSDLGSTGQSSSDNGYTSGGVQTNSPTSSTTINVIQKFPFSVDANATDVGDLTTSYRKNVVGQSSTDNGYASGGTETPHVNIIDKFPFSTDANATDVGDLTVARGRPAGQSSTTHGYTSGGYEPPSSNIIDKFPFAVDANATDVGDLTTTHGNYSTGQSSSISGYTTGGRLTGGTKSNIIDKFPFSTDANATDVGDLINYTQASAGQSSTTYGYSSGGFGGPSSGSTLFLNVIQKFPFSVDANATDVGDLTVGRYQTAGQQV